MAIKKLNFSFEVPITALLSLIATGNAGLKIDVLGDDKTHAVTKALNGAHPGTKLLEGPKKAQAKKPHGNTAGQPRQRGTDANGKPMTAYSAIIKALAKAPDRTMTLADLRPIVSELGLNASSANSQISLMRTRGIAKRVGEGEYQLTRNGVAEALKRGLIRQTAEPKPEPKAKPKAKPEPVEATAPVTEGDNG